MIRNLDPSKQLFPKVTGIGADTGEIAVTCDTCDSVTVRFAIKDEVPKPAHAAAVMSVVMSSLASMGPVPFNICACPGGRIVIFCVHPSIQKEYLSALQQIVELVKATVDEHTGVTDITAAIEPLRTFRVELHDAEELDIIKRWLAKFQNGTDSEPYKIEGNTIWLGTDFKASDELWHEAAESLQRVMNMVVSEQRRPNPPQPDANPSGNN